MYLFSEKNLSDENTVWWCGALTYLRTNDIFSQNQQYTASDMIQLKEVRFISTYFTNPLLFLRDCSKCIVSPFSSTLN